MQRLRESLEGNHTPATFPEPASAAPKVGGNVVYEDLNKADLKALAALRKIDVKSRMTKDQLVAVLKEADDVATG